MGQNGTKWLGSKQHTSVSSLARVMPSSALSAIIVCHFRNSLLAIGYLKEMGMKRER